MEQEHFQGFDGLLLGHFNRWDKFSLDVGMFGMVGKTLGCLILRYSWECKARQPINDTWI